VPFTPFDPATRELLHRVYDAAWQDLETAGRVAVSVSHQAAMKARLTSALLAAANSGERDFGRLKVLALEGI
jgi:hypothetical protein